MMASTKVQAVLHTTDYSCVSQHFMSLLFFSQSHRTFSFFATIVFRLSIIALSFDLKCINIQSKSINKKYTELFRT